MRLGLMLLISCIIFLLVFTSIVDSVWVPSRPKEASSVPESTIGTTIYSDQTIEKNKKYSDSSSSQESSLPAGFDPNDYSGDQIQIYQIISPNNNYFLINKTYKIKIDMKGVRRELRNILIMEMVDPSIRIDSIEPPMIYDRFNSSDYYFIDKKNYSLNNNTLLINISKWRPQYHVTFSYDIITPNKIGIFGLQTNIRFAKTEPKIQDPEFDREIEVKTHEFEVNVDAERLNVDVGTPMELNYYIKYASPCSLDTHPSKIIFETSDQYDIYLNSSCYNTKQKYDGRPINLTNLHLVTITN